MFWRRVGADPDPLEEQTPGVSSGSEPVTDSVDQPDCSSDPERTSRFCSADY